MQRDVARVLIDRRAIARRVEEIAAAITRDLADAGVVEDAGGDGAESATRGEPLTLVPILTGSIIFVSDLVRHLPLRMQIRMLSVSSYPGASTQSKGARLREELSWLPDSLAGQHLLVIDDVLDSGSTLDLVTGVLARRAPASLRTCVFLRKQRPEAMRVPVDYVGFDIPDEFVVGYGLDFNDYYRNLPDIVTLRPEVYAATAAGGNGRAGKGQQQ
jgi:hypoxanthine phosphoribosyltransferase